jgi:hypothetical protein
MDSHWSDVVARRATRETRTMKFGKLRSCARPRGHGSLALDDEPIHGPLARIRTRFTSTIVAAIDENVAGGYVGNARRGSGASACISPPSFDPALGRQAARQWRQGAHRLRQRRTRATAGRASLGPSDDQEVEALAAGRRLCLRSRPVPPRLGRHQGGAGRRARAGAAAGVDRADRAGLLSRQRARREGSGVSRGNGQPGA